MVVQTHLTSSESACSWASKASPTLGCSIEISGDIYCQYVGMSVCLSYFITALAELRGPRACSKSFLGGKDCDTRVIDFDYALEQL